MKKVKKVFKYGTGEVIPEGATYLTTEVQLEIPPMYMTNAFGTGVIKETEKCWLVWHYFLVDVEEKNG